MIQLKSEWAHRGSLRRVINVQGSYKKDLDISSGMQDSNAHRTSSQVPAVLCAIADIGVQAKTEHFDANALLLAAAAKDWRVWRVSRIITLSFA